MPLYKTIKPAKNTIVLVWKITEDLSFFQNIFLNNNSKNRTSRMKSEIHKKGFLSIRHLLKTLNYSDDDLYYTADGKPHLNDGKQISISHSFTFSTIIISNQLIGIDIEKNREKIIRIADKFIGNEINFLKAGITIYNKNESNIQNSKHTADLVKKLTVIWGAKESLFKTHPDGGLLFKEHITIEKFNSNSKKSLGWINTDNYQEEYNLFFEHFEGFTLVYAVINK